MSDTFEHRRVYLGDLFSPYAQEQIDRFGNDGWELSCIIGADAWMKRRKKSKDTLPDLIDAMETLLGLSGAAKGISDEYFLKVYDRAALAVERAKREKSAPATDCPIAK